MNGIKEYTKLAIGFLLAGIYLWVRFEVPLFLFLALITYPLDRYTSTLFLYFTPASILGAYLWLGFEFHDNAWRMRGNQ